MSKKSKMTKKVKQSNLGRRNGSSVEDMFNKFKEQHPHCENTEYEDALKLLVSNEELIKKRRWHKSNANVNNSII